MTLHERSKKLAEEAQKGIKGNNRVKGKGRERERDQNDFEERERLFQSKKKKARASIPSWKVR